MFGGHRDRRPARARAGVERRLDEPSSGASGVSANEKSQSPFSRRTLGEPSAPRPRRPRSPIRPVVERERERPRLLPASRGSPQVVPAGGRTPGPGNAAARRRRTHASRAERGGRWSRSMSWGHSLGSRWAGGQGRHGSRARGGGLTEQYVKRLTRRQAPSAARFQTGPAINRPFPRVSHRTNGPSRSRLRRPGPTLHALEHPFRPGLPETVTRYTPGPRRRGAGTASPRSGACRPSRPCARGRRGRPGRPSPRRSISGRKARGARPYWSICVIVTGKPSYGSASALVASTIRGQTS
jgi:hypothetical protein